MPSLEISIPKTDREQKAQLARKLTEAFAQHTRFEPEIFGIRIHEYDKDQAAYAGELCDEPNARAYLHAILCIPKINRETKQKIVASFTRVYVEVFNDKAMQPVIHIHEYPYDNVGVEGKLLSDAYDECKNQKFYYDLGE